MSEQKIWDSEPDLLMFKALGYECQVARHMDLRHLCGYIWVNADHPWFGKDYNDLSDVDVHGGLTFSRHLTETSKFGFDCSHLGDLIPKLNHLANDDSGDVYRDMGYVVNELIKLARQANHAEGYGVQEE
tara:strand:+ start:497 stop:886 length:390 start_codon:yes stop_codon:yes gene_type:complete